MLPIGESAPHSGDKITVVGVGAVGMATAFSLLTQVNNFLLGNGFKGFITVFLCYTGCHQ